MACDDHTQKQQTQTVERHGQVTLQLAVTDLAYI
jgi:hypothetical protein